MSYNQLLSSGTLTPNGSVVMNAAGRVQIASDGGDYCACCVNAGGGGPPPPPPPPGGCASYITPTLSCSGSFTSGQGGYGATFSVTGGFAGGSAYFDGSTPGNAGSGAGNCGPTNMQSGKVSINSSGDVTFSPTWPGGCFYCKGTGTMWFKSQCGNTVSCSIPYNCQLQVSPTSIAFTLGVAASVTVSVSDTGIYTPITATASGLTGVTITGVPTVPVDGSASFTVHYDGSGSTAESGTITVSEGACCDSATINVSISACTSCNCPTGAVNIGLSGSITFPAQNGGNPIPLASGQNLTNGTSGGCSWGPTGTFTAPTSGAYAVVTTASISGYTPSGSSCGYFYTCSLGGWYVLTTGGTHYTWNWASGNYSGEKPIPACSLTGFGWLLNQCHDAGSSTAHDTPQGTASYSSTGQSGSITFG